MRSMTIVLGWTLIYQNWAIVRRNLLLITWAAHLEFDFCLRTPKEAKKITRITKSLQNT